MAPSSEMISHHMVASGVYCSVNLFEVYHGLIVSVYHKRMDSTD